MLVQRFTDYLTRSILPHRRNATLRADAVRLRLEEADAVSLRLEQAEHRVAYCQRLVAGWQVIMALDQAAGHDVSVVRRLLQRFRIDLKAAMTDKAEAEEAQAKQLLDLFEGSKGRQPKTDQELHDWLTHQRQGCDSLRTNVC